ncbi:hypothetical protein B0T16DRAFT_143585 [Cercophora newfieldiana]|uniref:Uncharacterized protein n=1 Tax=Cercophora newfieldiana TaxID=92897 RepID=A0AA40CQK6_9PEZI|nr:hypothetical protein B0T16DRAFT_143585 [Cercophora newfieldiana]
MLPSIPPSTQFPIIAIPSRHIHPVLLHPNSPLKTPPIIYPSHKLPIHHRSVGNIQPIQPISPTSHPKTQIYTPPTPTPPQIRATNPSRQHPLSPLPMPHSYSHSPRYPPTGLLHPKSKPESERKKKRATNSPIN